MSMEIQAALDVADETDSFLQITDVIYDKEADLGYNDLSASEKVIYCIDGLLREVENGGFVQFFRQDAGAYAEDTLLALEAIKAKDSQAVFQSVLNLFPNAQVPSDENARLELFEHIESDQADTLSELDEQFHETGENLVALSLNYVQKNLKNFK